MKTWFFPHSERLKYISAYQPFVWSMLCSHMIIMVWKFGLSYLLIRIFSKVMQWIMTEILCYWIIMMVKYGVDRMLLKQGPYGGRPILQHVLIVTPSSLVANWQNEFLRWLGRERIQTFVVDQVILYVLWLLV